jgi:hypothetical protein
MRLSQPKEATKEFTALLEAQLGSINPAYCRNPKVKGIRQEYLRELGDGLFAIHSVICIRGTFHHCFCLSLHHSPVGPHLYSPLTIGGRCDHNYTITKACHRDLGLSPVDPVSPFRMSDSHQFRTGADRIIRRCTAEAESRLLPAYLDIWSQTLPALRGLLDYYMATPAGRIDEEASTYPGPRQELSCHTIQFQHIYSSLLPSQTSAFFAATIQTIPDVIRDIITSRNP